LVDLYLSNAWCTLNCIISNVFFITNPRERLVLVNFSDRNWSWWHFRFSEFILMAMDDNISSSLNCFFWMRSFLVLSNFNISINSYVSVIMVVVLAIDFNCCTVILLRFWIHINFYLQITIGWIFVFSLSIFYFIWVLRSFLILFWSLVWRLFFISLIHLSFIVIFKEFNFFWAQFFWDFTCSIKFYWDISYLLFLSFVDSFKLLFQLDFPLLSLLISFFFIFYCFFNIFFSLFLVSCLSL